MFFSCTGPPGRGESFHSIPRVCSAPGPGRGVATRFAWRPGVRPPPGDRTRILATAARRLPWRDLMARPNRPGRSSWLAAFASGEGRGTSPARLRGRPLALEALEDRIVLDGTVKLSGGMLVITGTVGNDTALVQQVAGGKNQP